VTLLEAIQRSADFLARKGVDSPRLQSELLLAQALGLRRMQLYLSFERVLTDTETESLRELIRRRGQREPLQHIVGSTSFCGLELKVGPEVLVPRPETELLAEAAWEFANRVAGGGVAAPRVLDFGTGSGCLAIAIAVKCPACSVCALEVSATALAVARWNADRHQVASRVQFVEGAGLDDLAPENRFHLVVGNPPYIASAEIAGLQPEVRDYDPRAALDGGEDGLRFYRMLAAEVPGRLLPGGRMMLEFGDGQADAIAALLREQKWVVEAIREDYTHRPRFLVAGRE
jgi:release factor glutamine methyltransferase